MQAASHAFVSKSVDPSGRSINLTPPSGYMWADDCIGVGVWVLPCLGWAKSGRPPDECSRKVALSDVRHRVWCPDGRPTQAPRGVWPARPIRKTSRLRDAALSIHQVSVNQIDGAKLRGPNVKQTRCAVKPVATRPSCLLNIKVASGPPGRRMGRHDPSPASQTDGRLFLHFDAYHRAGTGQDDEAKSCEGCGYTVDLKTCTTHSLNTYT